MDTTPKEATSLTERYKEYNINVDRAIEERQQFTSKIRNATKVSERALSFWLNGRARPIAENRDKIAKALNVTEQELFPDKN